MTPFMTGEIRVKALAHAIDYHSRTFERPQYNVQMPTSRDLSRPTAEQIIATAEKFAGFLLVEKKTQPPRAKK